jgi:hypothetical protein
MVRCAAKILDDYLNEDELNGTDLKTIGKDDMENENSNSIRGK